MKALATTIKMAALKCDPDQVNCTHQRRQRMPGKRLLEAGRCVACGKTFAAREMRVWELGEQI